MTPIHVSDLAERDLDEIWRYIAKRSHSVEIADGVVDSITEVFPLFVQSPEAGTRRDEIDPGVRGFPVGKYIIYYRETGQQIVIARVIHGMRHQKSAFLDRD